jgi:glucosyl-3-phosphoglycerate synthase
MMLGTLSQTGGVLRTFHFREFDFDRLVAAKKGRRISVVLPARDEAATVAAIVRTVLSTVPLVDEVVVIDDHSSDATAAVARAAGATVVSAADVLPEYGDGFGKGEAMWKSLSVVDGDLIVFCDADVRNFATHFVTGLLGPLLTRDDIGFVKGFYDRPLDGKPGEGGRVTELVAKPLLALLFPHLAGVAQPLAGECAARRDVLERVPFVSGYGVELGLLLDVADRFGIGAMAQTDLGVRIHRNRSLAELAPQAAAILQTALARDDVDERPPMISVPDYRESA